LQIHQLRPKHVIREALNHLIEIGHAFQQFLANQTAVQQKGTMVSNPMVTLIIVPLERKA
jgi:hypothetical protein